jgi:nitrate reductase gamma subunit
MRLAASLRYALYGLTAVLLASGLAWLAVHYFGADSGDTRDWALKSMAVHGAAAMAALVLVGSTVALHVARAWRERKNRTSGSLLAVVLLAIAVTGCLLYYAGSETARAVASATHWLLGLGLPALLAAHVSMGRRSSSELGD